MDFPKLCDLVLAPPRRGWTVRWNKLHQQQLLDERPARLKTSLDFLRANAPEIAYGQPGIVIDLQPGTGELLEISRRMGHIPYVIPAAHSDTNTATALLFERQDILVDSRTLLSYVEFTSRQDDLLNLYGNQCRLVCCRGDFDKAMQSLFTLTDGKLAWRLHERQIDLLQRFFSFVQQLLADSGLFLFMMPLAINWNEADAIVRDLATQEGLQLVRRSGRLWKWRRI